MKFARHCFLGIVILLAGCARVSTTTTLHADGSFTRKVIYTVSKTSGMGGPPPEGVEAPPPVKPEGYFKLPGDASTKVARGEDKNALTATTTKEVPAGAPPL